MGIKFAIGEQDVKELNEEIELDKLKDFEHSRVDALKDQWLKDNRDRLLEVYVNAQDNFRDFLNETWEYEKEDYI